MKLLADTSALLGLGLADDSHHEGAMRFARKSPRARFVMTELILSEVATRVRARADAARAVAFADDTLRSRRYDVVFVDSVLLRGALARMRRLADRRLSLTDCATSRSWSVRVSTVPSRSIATSGTAATGYCLEAYARPSFETTGVISFETVRAMALDEAYPMGYNLR